MGTKLTWEIYIKKLVQSGLLQPEQYLVTVLQQFNHSEIQCSVLRGQKKKKEKVMSKRYLLLYNEDAVPFHSVYH